MENIEAKDPSIVGYVICPSDATVGYVICPSDAHNVPQTAQVTKKKQKNKKTKKKKTAQVESVVFLA